MLKPAEKSYIHALDCLRRKDYREALKHFDSAASHFANNKDFNLLHETVRLLLSVKTELGRFDEQSEPEAVPAGIETADQSGQRTPDGFYEIS